jgi:choline dehydrogenase
LEDSLLSSFDFIICGSGSSGSVVARRLAENPDVNVLLLEAGGTDEVASVSEAGDWPSNLGSKLDWNFRAEPNANLNGRAIPLNMGKVLGGGSSINVQIWARGHKNDWDFFAKESGDAAWNYESVLKIYRRIEDWHGSPDPQYRGTGGIVFVQPAPDPNPLAPATVSAARSVGIPTFENPNGRMMEGPGGAAIMDIRVRDGKRQSVFRSYTYPYMDRKNLTVLTDAWVPRVIFEGTRAIGVDFIHRGNPRRVMASKEVVLSLGAIQTPKLLMQSGIGNEQELNQFNIPVIQHLPGVGQNYQDHFGIGCIWEYPTPLPPRNNVGESTFFWTSDSRLDTPDLHMCQAEIPMCSPETASRFAPPAASWTMFAGIARPKSTGRVRLSGPAFSDAPVIDTNLLSHPADLKAAIAVVELCREISNSPELRPFIKREVMPGSLKGAELEDFIRDAAVTYWHQSCTAKMGRDALSVVDSRLKVYGIDGLRIADASIMPRVTTGNTMASCVVIGERASEMLQQEHGI